MIYITNMDKVYDFDVLVIGSGPGGYVAAIRAAQLGLKAALVERGAFGGVCLNMGCIPTKAIIHQAEIFRGRSALAAMGVAVDDSGFRYEAVRGVSREAADTLSKGVAYLLKKNNVEAIVGTARLVSAHEVSVDGARTVSAGAVIVATGSRPKVVPGLEFDGVRVLSSDDALMLAELPRRALIVGAGAIGVEFAHIFNAFGSEVHLVEMAERVLPLEDSEVTAVLKRSFTKRGIKIYTSSKVSSYIIEEAGSVKAVVEGADGGKTEVSVDKIFVMTGRTPNTEDIGLTQLGVAQTDGFIIVNGHYQTNVDSVYAIGDVVASSPLLAHVASRAGEIAAECIAGEAPRGIDMTCVPSVVYCEPQVASFGLTQGAALERGITIEKASFPFRGCGKAVVLGETDGMVKVIVDPSTDKIIGAHIIGAGVAELIHELLLAREAGAGPSAIANMVHAHPTLSEAVMEAARALDGQAIHV
jgi:dihydrolipoamide dehydrogenase